MGRLSIIGQPRTAASVAITDHSAWSAILTNGFECRRIEAVSIIEGAEGAGGCVKT